MEGGLGQLLTGDGKGGFAPVGAGVSGIVVPEDASALAAPDLDGDGRSDLVFSVNQGNVRVFLRTGAPLEK